MGVEKISVNNNATEERRDEVEERFKPIKITDVDRKKAQARLDALEAQGREINFYDDFSDEKDEDESDNINENESEDKLEDEQSLNNKKKDEKKLMTRRGFLKSAFKTAVGVGATVALGTVGREILDNLDAKKEKEERKSTENLEPSEQKENKKEEEVKIENLADHYLKAYYELSKDSEKFPGDVFETDLIIAQQCQESRGEIDAKSHSGALGVMQNMTASIKDVTRYLNILMRKTDFEWKGPRELSKKQILRIKNLLTKKSDYSRAFGKIYLMQLWDNKRGYGIGREHYKKGDIKSTQIELMGAYNAGHSRVKGKTLEEWIRLRDKYQKVHTKSAQRKYRAYREAIDYVHKIMNYKERLGNIRDMIKEIGLELGVARENFLVREIALKLDEVHGVLGEKRKEKLESETRKYLERIKNLIESKNRLPSHEEIKRSV